MNILRFLESIRTPFWDTFFSIVTRLGEQIILIVLFCLVFWCINKKLGYFIGMVFFFSAILVQGLKPIFRIARPWVADPTFTTVGYSVDAATGYAFPSGHTQAAAAYLVPLGVVFKKKVLKIIFFALAVLVAFSRMYLGVHYLWDVLASLLITAGVVALAFKFFYQASESNKRDIALSLVIFVISVAALILAAVLNHTGATTAVQVRDTVIAGGAGIGFAVGMYIERTYIKFSVKAQNLPMQAVKLILGIAGVVGIQEGARIIGDGLVADAIRYFLMILWLVAIYPLIIKYFFTAKEKSTESST